MKACVERTSEEAKEITQQFEELKEKTKDIKCFNNYERVTGYAHYKFKGLISKELVEALGRNPTVDEIMLLVDRGWSHFGASCSIIGNKFSGRVSTD